MRFLCVAKLAANKAKSISRTPKTLQLVTWQLISSQKDIHVRFFVRPYTSFTYKSEKSLLMTSKVNSHITQYLYPSIVYPSAMDVPLASKAFPSPSPCKQEKSNVDGHKSSSKHADLNPHANDVSDDYLNHDFPFLFQL